MASARTGAERIHVNAPPQTVWDLLSDVERMGEWSPECYRVAWLDGASPPAKPGARFKGSNKWGPVRWSMTCEVKTADPGREISWTTIQGERELVTWTYRLEPNDGGTDVVESFDVHWLPLGPRIFEDYLMVNRDKHRSAGMAATLQRIKAAAEAA
ncbi:MAG TPA: SRPBCC family protein [Mycobacteriales bacterium]|jgi:uncharacterized protein YndB with AHSA1/START domain|nr:SRPBCC family protein [Mycobacteriales bacterium]